MCLRFVQVSADELEREIGKAMESACHRASFRLLVAEFVERHVVVAKLDRNEGMINNMAEVLDSFMSRNKVKAIIHLVDTRHDNATQVWTDI